MVVKEKISYLNWNQCNQSKDTQEATYNEFIQISYHTVLKLPSLEKIYFIRTKICRVELLHMSHRIISSQQKCCLINTQRFLFRKNEISTKYGTCLLSLQVIYPYSLIYVYIITHNFNYQKLWDCKVLVVKANNYQPISDALLLVNCTSTDDDCPIVWKS